MFRYNIFIITVSCIIIIIGFKFVIDHQYFYFRGIMLSPKGGYLFIVAGLFGLYFEIIVKKGIENDSVEIMLKCPNCKKIYKKYETTELKCPNCSSNLESLKGYFDRHPDEKV